MSHSIVSQLYFCLVLTFGLLVGGSVYGAVSVSPLIIEFNAEPRDTAIHTITLTNSDSRPTRLYASVHEIAVGEEGVIKEFVPASMSDRSVAITSWLEISRARIDLQPGASTELPLTIRINHDTPPGLYHAFIGFASAPNRDEAEAKVLAGQGLGVVLRISVGSTAREQLRLVSFTTDRFSLKPDEGVFTYVIENTGDVPLSPSGDVIIYDTRGRELTTVTLETDADTIILPGEQKTFSKPLPYIDRIGRNKAYLTLEYGSVNTAAIFDTNFYYSIPWYYLLVIMVLLALVFVALIVLIRRHSYASDDYVETNEAQDLPLYVGSKREHNEYEHDINLKRKDS